ncbi:MAG: hypothetical protein QNJ42_22250 [Crocosphaera sp.]|nr:hypothetical protein [Crocosphaera sp.]
MVRRQEAGGVWGVWGVWGAGGAGGDWEKSLIYIPPVTPSPYPPSGNCYSSLLI